MSALDNRIFLPSSSRRRACSIDHDPEPDHPRIFEYGNLEPGIYKIQNLRSETYLDVHHHSKEVCCRPVHASDAQKWEIKPLGIGYSIQMVNLMTRPGALCVC